MKRRSLKIFFATALAVLFTSTTSTPAQAAAENCPPGANFCLWPGQNFTGAMVVLPSPGWGCYPASTAGLDTIGSAKHGWSIEVMVTYSDESCEGQQTHISREGNSLNPPAKSYVVWVP